MRLTRREFMAATAGTIACPTIAQVAGRTYRVGMLVYGESGTPPAWLSAFEEQLARRGFARGRNLDLRRLANWGATVDSQVQAKELIDARCDVIVVGGAGRARVMLSLTSTVPIVLMVDDPVGSGLVKNLTRPGANVTGVSSQLCELLRKRFELMRELVPAVRRVALIAESTSSCAFTREALLGPGSSIELLRVDPTTGRGPAAWLQEALVSNPDVVMPHGIVPRRELEAVRKLTAQHPRVAIISDDGWTEGAVLSLGPDTKAIARSCADQVSKILAGAKPGDLPIELVSQFELIVYRQRARELGLQVPASILVRADRVID